MITMSAMPHHFNKFQFDQGLLFKGLIKQISYVKKKKKTILLNQNLFKGYILTRARDGKIQFP